MSTPLNSYSTGTVAVSADGTTVTGTSTIWSSAGNVKPGDLFQSGHFCVPITDVADDTHLTITPWPGSTLSGASYVVWKVSQQRIVGETYARDVDKMVGALNTSGYFVFVDIAETVPDPSLGDDGQYAFQPTTGKTWAKVSGAWSYLGIYKAFQLKGAWSGATAYTAGDVVTLSGSSYVCVLDHTNHTPPNATYWQLLAAKGDTGATGATGAAGANAPTYGGTSTTSLAIGTGSKAFTTQAGLAYQNGARVRASSAANTSNWMEGLATYSGTTLTINVATVGGSGTFSDWNFNVIGEPGAGSVSSVNGQTGAIVSYFPPQGRITLASGVPVMGASQAGATTVYYTPYAGDMVPIYNGTNMYPMAFGEISQATTDTTKAPAAIGPEEVWDIFGFNDSGVPRLSRQRWSRSATVTMTVATPCVVTWGGHALRQGDPVIFTTTGALPTGITAGTVYYVGASPGASTFNIATSFANALAGVHIATTGSQSGTHTGENRTTSRGYTFTRVNGILLNTSAITNGPAAQRGTWLATIRSNSSSTIDFIFGTVGPVAGAFNVWNAYNRVSVGCSVIDTGASYTFISSAFRQAHGNAAMLVSFVVGSSEDAAHADYMNVCQSAAVSGSVFRIGVGYDSTTVAYNNSTSSAPSAVAAYVSPNVPVIINNPAPGTHFFAALEDADGTNAATFNVGGAVSTAGLQVMLRM